MPDGQLAFTTQALARCKKAKTFCGVLQKATTLAS
jgi:hypothetical protein